MTAGTAFGLDLDSDIALPGLSGRESADRPKLVLRSSSASPDAASRELVWRTSFSGHEFTVWRDTAGEHLFRLDGEADYHLSADATRLGYHRPAETGSPEWLRQLMDTVLWSAAALRGVDLLHAAAVSAADRAIALVASSGTGKTSLASALGECGAGFFTDDILAYEVGDHSVKAHPGPALRNLPAGLSQAGSRGATLARFPASDEIWEEVNVPARRSVPLAAIVVLDRSAGAAPDFGPIEAPFTLILNHSVGLPRARPDHARESFERLARLVELVPIWQLVIGSDESPSAAARRLLDRLGVRL